METLVAFVGYHSYMNNTRVILHPPKLKIFFFFGRHFVDRELQKIYANFWAAHKSIELLSVYTMVICSEPTAQPKAALTSSCGEKHHPAGCTELPQQILNPELQLSN